MQVLEVRRLSPTEAYEEKEFDAALPGSKTPFPEWVSPRMLMSRLGVAKSTLWEYRKIALEYCDEYCALSLFLNPDYLLGCSNTPDKPPFSSRQAEILEEINLLFRQYRKKKVVISIIQQRYCSS